MEGLEPWDDVLNSGSTRDMGILDRILKMLQPHILRLSKTNNDLQKTLKSNGLHAYANIAYKRRNEICKDILAVIGIIKRHNNEVKKWNIDASREQYIFASDIFKSDIFKKSIK